MMLSNQISQGIPKILHLSFHKGCINDIKQVAEALNLDVVSHFILESESTRDAFDGIPSGNDIYNITHDRAARIWHCHHEYFEQFDAIIVSDTAPLARIFLQNGWKKPLIIWVCNRFDYAHGNRKDIFPDANYYTLFAEGLKSPHVRVVPYTYYEVKHAQTKHIHIKHEVIKPMGIMPSDCPCNSAIPTSVDKPQTLFLYPRLDDNQRKLIVEQCALHAIPLHSGVYNGPDDLIDFKGVIYFPYQWSNLALFENMQRGIVHFVPTFGFVKKLMAQRQAVRFVTLEPKLSSFVEWYNPDYKDCIVYFDSWADLKRKIKTVDYSKMRQKIKAMGVHHRQIMLDRWRKVFSSLKLL